MFSVVMGERRGYFKVTQLYHNKTPILAGTTAESIAIHLSVSGHLSMHTWHPPTSYGLRVPTGCVHPTAPH